MLRYAITDRKLYKGTEQQQQAALVRQAEALAREGIDFLQLREKDLDDTSLLALAQQMQAAIRSTGSTLRLLLNGSPALARQAGLEGVHLPFPLYTSERLMPLRAGGDLLVSIGCHTVEEAAQAAADADLILFAPVFETRIAGRQIREGTGLDALQQACRVAAPVPVLALGGVTGQNARMCMGAGAAGVAGIRLFTEITRDGTSASPSVNEER